MSTTTTAPVTCPTCAREFKTAGAMKTHATRTHKETPVTVTTAPKAAKAPKKATKLEVVVTQAPAAAPKAKKVKASTSCACAGWVAMIPGDAAKKEARTLTGAPTAHRVAARYDAETNYTTIDLGCGKPTASTFAPGHDARFKGLAITAQRFGGLMAKDGVSMSPRAAIMEVSPGLVGFLPAA